MNYSPNLLKILGTDMASTVTRTNRPEHKLFQAIIMQAFEDCTSFTYSKIDAYNKQDSINWFVGNSEIFKEICWNADFDPEYVMGVFKRLIKEEKILYNRNEKLWMEYRARYVQYRAANTKEERREIKKKIDLINVPNDKKES